MRVFALAALSILLIAPATSAEPMPDLFASAASKAGVRCAAKHGPRVILCLVRATDSEADKIGTGMVATAHKSGFVLEGWTLTLVNARDYVVSLPFRARGAR